MSPAAIGRRVDSGEWVPVHPRVYRVATHDLTPRAILARRGALGG